MKHILVLAPNWIGDAAMVTPALRILARRYPGAEITVAGRPVICALLEGLPYITGCIVIPSRPNVGAMVKLGKQLAPFARDLCVAFPHSTRAAILARLTGAKKRLGYKRGNRSWLLTDLVEPHRVDGKISTIYMSHEYMHLLTALGCEADHEGLELAASQDEVDAVQALLSEGSGPVIGVAPGAAFGPSKCWLPERYAEVINRLHEDHGAQCILLTGPGEEATRQAVCDALTAPLLECQSDPPSLERLKAIISQLDVFIGNDSGPRHMAIAFKKPVICIMGSTSPAYTDSPWEVGEVLRIDVDCGPCQKPVCETDHRCMTGVHADQVYDAVVRHLP